MRDILHVCGRTEMCIKLWSGKPEGTRPLGSVDGGIKPTGHVTHQQFNIQQLYVLSTLYLCVLYLSENKQRLVPLTS